MTREDKFNKKLAADLKQLAEDQIKPGSPEMERYLAVGYPKIKTRENAKDIIEGWTKDHSYCPYELKEDALAFLEALNAKPSKKDIYHPETNSLGQFVTES
jgi:hypothetical protein